MSEATATNHLSIGEVLSLVQEDFPDVTISKIRFLESQGLIAPERTGSGYRKFYGADIERLRWILRQQRDNFLPLKVIKKMLDDGVDLSGTLETQPTLWATTDEAEEAPGAPVDDATSSATATTADAGGARATDGGTDSARPRPDADADDVERATYRSPSHPAVASARPATGSARRRSGASGSSPAADAQSDRPSVPSDATARPVSSSSDVTTPTASTPGPDPRRDRPGRGESSRSSPSSDSRPASGSSPRAEVAGDAPTPGASDVERPAHATPADVVAALQEEPRSARKRRQKAAGAAADSRGDADGVPGDTADSGAATSTAPATAPTAAATPGPAASIASGPARDALLSADELLETTGISAELLADLEQYGLVVAASLGGRSAYDAEAIDVARMAAKYAELGVEPRHLRMYKVSAEREAGFVEQLVVPLIKQRNPAARQLAVDRCDELIAMGAELHAALLRRQLRRIIGG